MCSLGIEPTTFALLTRYSTIEPQEHLLHPGYYFTLISQVWLLLLLILGVMDLSKPITVRIKLWLLTFLKSQICFCLLDDKMCKNIPGGTVKNQNRALSTFTNEKSSLSHYKHFTNTQQHPGYHIKLPCVVLVSKQHYSSGNVKSLCNVLFATAYWDSVFVYVTSLAFSSCECNCLVCFSDSITLTMTHRCGNIMFPQEWQIMAYWNIGEGKRTSGKLKIKEDANLIWHTQRLGLISDGLLWMTKKPWIKQCSARAFTAPKPS